MIARKLGGELGRPLPSRSELAITLQNLWVDRRLIDRLALASLRFAQLAAPRKEKCRLFAGMLCLERSFGRRLRAVLRAPSVDHYLRVNCDVG